MRSKYKDGVLSVKRKTTPTQNDLGQMVAGTPTLLGSAYYYRSRCSNADKDIAYRNSYTVDFTVNIPMDIEVKTTDIVVIGTATYEVKNIYEDFQSRKLSLVLGGAE